MDPTFSEPAVVKALTCKKKLKDQVKAPINDKKASEMRVHLFSRVSSKTTIEEGTELL